MGPAYYSRFGNSNLRFLLTGSATADWLCAAEMDTDMVPMKIVHFSIFPKIKKNGLGPVYYSCPLKCSKIIKNEEKKIIINNNKNISWLDRDSYFCQQTPLNTQIFSKANVLLPFSICFCLHFHFRKLCYVLISTIPILHQCPVKKTHNFVKKIPWNRNSKLININGPLRWWYFLSLYFEFHFQLQGDPHGYS